MITLAQVQRMARYNGWQNRNLYDAADPLPPEERTRDRGAFFGSIQGTLAHLVWADQTWLQRFDPSLPPPRAASNKESPAAYPNWDELRVDRQACDAAIVDWAAHLAPEWLNGDLTWVSGTLGATVTRPRWQIVTHFFNHQTHHRGQVHCLLTQCGAKPGVTDLIMLSE